MALVVIVKMVRMRKALVTYDNNYYDLAVLLRIYVRTNNEK